MKKKTKLILLLTVFVMALPALSKLMAGDGHDEADHSAGKMIAVYDVRKGEVMTVEKIEKTDAEWKKQLSPEQYHVTRQEGTERAFSHSYHNLKEKGVFKCSNCGTDLYSSETKFDSGTGWPSFWAPVSDKNVGTKTDRKFFMLRTEVHCSRCGAHLGHVFDDGPEPTGKRHCINGVSLNFVPENK